MSARKQKTRTRRNPRHKTAPPIDPVQLGRLLQRRKVGGLVLAFLAILLIGLLDRYVGVFPVDDDWHRYHRQSFEVVRVVDGDTLDLRVADGDRATTRVRLWGVDTPEMGRPHSDALPEPFAVEATKFTRDALEGQRVTVYLQDHRIRGRYGRLLAYIEMPDGRLLNAALIEQGLSKHDSRWSHDRIDAFDALEQQARDAKRGLWGQ